MAVAVSRDLTVHVLQDSNAVKLMDSRQALRAAVQRGEPKSIGVGQLMLGVVIILYSIPLHLTEHTEVTRLGVPWWSGLTFVFAGCVAIVLDKYCTIKNLYVCLIVSVVSIALSVMAIIIYSVDIERNPESPCIKQVYELCDDKHYSTKLSKGLKSALLLFTLAQMVISAVLFFLLYRQRQDFMMYNPLQDGTSSRTILSEEEN